MASVQPSDEPSGVGSGGHDAAQDASAITLGVEGDGISPRSFDVLPTLAFVHAFVAVLDALVGRGQDEQSLRLTGLTIGEGSVAFELRSPEPERIARLANDAQHYLLHEEKAPRGARGKIVELRAALGRMPTSHRPYLEARSKRIVLPTAFDKPGPYREVTTMRFTVLSAGGRRPRVRVSSDTLPLLSLRANRHLAERAGSALYRQIEAVVTVVSEGSNIVDAELHDFDLVEEVDAQAEITRWKTWFADVGREWEDVDDIERELGRGGDS